MKNHPNIKATLLFSLVLLNGALSVVAQSGTWTNNLLTLDTNRLDTAWSDTTNWLNTVVADGADSSAFFNTIDIPAGGSNATIFVTADATNGVSLTNGNMYFGDTVKTDGVGNWVLVDSGLPVTLDNIASPNSVIDVNLTQGAANNLVTGWGTAIILPNLTGTNALVKSGPSHLILNPTSGNSFSGGMVISNGMVQLGVNNQTGTANSAAPGTGLIAFRGGSLRLQNAAIPGNSPGNGGGGVPGLPLPVLVPQGASGTIYLSARSFPALGATDPLTTLPATISGGGTLNLIVDFVRDNLGGDWTGFTGRVVVASSARQSSDLRFNSTFVPAGWANATVSFTNNGVNANTVFMYNPGMPVGTVLQIGTMEASIPGIVSVISANTTVNNGGGNSAPLVLQVGSLNADASFSGNFPAGAGSIGIIKVGTGTWVLNGPTVDYTGITVVSNGVLQFGAGTSGTPGRSAVVSNYSAIAFGRTDAALSVTNIIDGTGVLIQRGSGRTTLAPVGGNNTYTGKTFATNGTLAVASQTALGALPGGFVADQLTLNGGSLAATATISINDLNRGISLGANGGGLGADGANTLTVVNVVSGAGNLTINNSGTVAPTGAHTYTGKTILQSGTLLLASENLGVAPGVATADQLTFNGGTLRSSATFAIDDANRGVTIAAGGGTIAPDAATTLTISRPVAGAGTLTKAGAGTLVLNGPSTHTGSTLINQGTLAIGASGGSSSALIRVNAGATFDVTATGYTLGNGQTLTGDGAVSGNLTAGSGSTISVGSSIGAMTVGGLSLSGGATNAVEINNATNDIINVTGNLSLAGVNTIRLDLLEPLSAGSHVLIKYNGTLTSGGVGNLVIAGYPVSRVIPSLVHNVANKSIDLVLTGSPLSIVWQGGLNGNAWDINTTANWVGPQTFFNGDGVTFDSTGAANSTVNLTTTLLPASVSVNAATAYTFSGAGKLSAGATLSKANSGTLNVLTVNDNSGDTTISGGTIQVGNGAASGSLGSGDIVNNGALAFNIPDTRTVPGQISGGGGLTVQAGTVALNGNNSYGTTVINAAGTVEVGNGGGTGSLGTGAVTDNGALIFRRTGTVTNAGAISGSGSLAVRAGGTVVLAANNSYAGSTTVENGTLQVGAGGTVGTLGTAGSVTVTNSGTLAFNRSDSLTNAVTILGTNGNFGQFGSGALVITNDANDYGGTLVTNGKLQLGDGVNASGRLGRGTITVTSPGSLVFNRPDVFTITNLIAGSGSMAQAGPTNLNVTTGGGANTFSGGTMISNSLIELVAPVTAPVLNGVQQVNSSGLGTGTVTFQGNSFLQFHWANQTDPDGGGAGNFANPVNVPAGQSGTFWLPGRMEFSSAVSGAGTVNLGVNYVRGNITGSWTNFTGLLNVITNVPNTNNVAHEFRVFNTNGFPNARVHLDFGTTMYWRGTANSVVPIGELSGEENTFITGTGGAEGGNNVTWRVGRLGTSSTYGGIIGGTVFVGLIKEGAGTLKLTGPNSYLGMTTISNGVLALSTNSVAANGEILSSTNVTIVAPASLNVLERSDATFNLGGSAAQVLAGNGTLAGNLAVGGLGTLSPGFSIGTLTISSNVTFAGGTYLVDINTAAAQTSDRVIARDVDLNTAVITVTNLGNNLKTGDTFQIIQASGVISGTPTSITGAVPPGPGANWDVSNLNVNGTIRAVLPPSPTLTNSVSGGGTTLDFAWDAAYLGWRLYVQTNSINVGLSTNWVVIQGTEGTTTYSAPIDTSSSSVFYRLSYP